MEQKECIDTGGIGWKKDGDTDKGDSGRGSRPSTRQMKQIYEKRVEERRETLHGSRTSLNTSQARGDQSEIDFSWVAEEENKLKTSDEKKKREGE